MKKPQEIEEDLKNKVYSGTHKNNPRLDTEIKISSNIMTVHLSPDGLIIKDEKEDAAEKYTEDHLPGVYCDGVQYFDLSEMHYVNNSSMAVMIDMLKSLLKIGVEVHFVNVPDPVKKKINETGLKHIIICDSNQDVEKGILL